jgi:hypothetical protein
MRWGNFIVIGLLIVIGLGVGGYFLVREIYRSSVLRPFQPLLAEFQAMKPQAMDEPNQQPCKGGVITIDVSTSSYDYYFFEMPPELKAADPASVKTIVFLNWSKVEIDKYEGGKPAYKHFCNLEVVDRETKVLLKRENFAGGEPPMTIDSRNSYGEGTKPYDSMTSFIRANTRR